MELNKLCELNGAPGDEKAVRDAIMAAASKVCDDVRIDRAGNVIAFKKGTKKTGRKHVILSAHMDEVAFMAMGATEDGMIRIQCVGGIDPRVCVSKHVVVGEEKVKGVIGAMAIHLQSAADRQRVLDFDSLYVDIGARSKDEALGVCPEGTYIYFDSKYEKFGDGCVVSKALDDRVGCYVMLKLLSESTVNDLTCAFVVKEEIGCRGAMAAAFNHKADAVLVLEGTTAGDMGAVPEVRQVCRVGKGVAVSFMDNGSIATRKLYKQVIDIAEKNNCHYQIKEGVAGGNDASAYQGAADAKATCVLSVPCRYIHGPSSVIKLSDVDDQLCLARAVVNSL